MSALGAWLRSNGGAARRATTELRFSLRAVLGGPWRAMPSQRFADLRSAEEYILSLGVPDEPSVLRVDATGPESERASHDWLLDPGFGAPMRLPEVAVCRGMKWLSVWEEFPRSSLTLYAAASVGVDPRRLVGAALACLRAVPPGSDVSRARQAETLPTIEAWVRGGPFSARAATMATEALAPAPSGRGLPPVPYADLALVRAEGYLLAVCSVPEAARVGVATALRDALDAMSRALAEHRRGSRLRAAAALAEIVRGEVTALEVLRAAASDFQGGAGA